jgi:hypothetical protein
MTNANSASRVKREVTTKPLSTEELRGVGVRGLVPCPPSWVLYGSVRSQLPQSGII